MASFYSLTDPKDVELETLIIRRIKGKGANIRVAVNGGQVTLSGMVDDYYTKRDIDSEVKGIGGVHILRSHIRVARIAD